MFIGSSGGGGVEGSSISNSNSGVRFFWALTCWFFLPTLIAAAWSLKPTLSPANVLLRMILNIHRSIHFLALASRSGGHCLDTIAWDNKCSGNIRGNVVCNMRYNLWVHSTNRFRYISDDYIADMWCIPCFSKAEKRHFLTIPNSSSTSII